MKRLLTILIRAIAWFDFGFRKLTAWLFSKLYQYERQGYCKQCGQCCKSIIITMETKFLKQHFLRNFAIWWNGYFNNLHHIGSFIKEGYMVFSCDSQLADGSCGNYRLRPLFCREYPRRFDYLNEPAVLPGCGYGFYQKSK